MRAWGIYICFQQVQTGHFLRSHIVLSMFQIHCWRLTAQLREHCHDIITSPESSKNERQRALIKAKRIYVLKQGGSVRGPSWPMLAPTLLGRRQKHNPVDKECWPRTTSWFHKKAQHPHVKASRPFSSKCWSCVIYKRRNERSLWSGYCNGEWSPDSCVSYIGQAM